MIETLADVGTVLELRPRWATSMITAFIRVEGQPRGRDRQQLQLAVGRGHRERRARTRPPRFMQLCDAFDIPILSLIDTPGKHGRAGGGEDRR